MSTPLPLGDAIAPPRSPLAGASLSETNSNPANSSKFDEMNESEPKVIGTDNLKGPKTAKPKAHILTIPQDMRDLIYVHVFTNTIADISEKGGQGAVRKSGILFSCKQLRNEATKPFYELSTFHGDSATSIISWAEKLSSIPRGD
ncbi:hypothetical protein TI39_contig378g00031 [Zymoseptoria brevis]|uniref:Uncharacterized protein n=1 Tax=Zymoseptoria brevis TaxID=1047168 RepID=A0A0F4GS58_9PEZI|nr:hypothetical protein TI39_contig378g00031 [Zymoseptoria brevis]